MADAQKLPSYDPSKDELLVQQLILGDKKAFSEIYQSYYLRMKKYVYLLLRDEQEAEDIIHDIFTSMWQKRTTMPTDIPLTGYLLGAVRHKCMDRHRRAKRQKAYTSEQMKNTTIITDPIAQKYAMDALDYIINSLPPDQQEAFQLHCHGFKHNEIMHQTGSAVQTIKNKLVNARKSLRKKFNRL